MAVYVDNYMAPFRGMLMSHLFADSEEELHAMARKIGLKKEWYQGDHYDVSITKRLSAIRAGAKQVTTREHGRWRVERRRLGLWPFNSTGAK